MKLTVIGPRSSGKTSLLAALYLTRRHRIGGDFAIKARGIGTFEDGFFDRIRHELSAVPIQWPRATLNRADFKLDFAFRVGEGNAGRILTKPVDLYDYRGGVLHGKDEPEEAEFSQFESTREELRDTEAAVILLNTRDILESNDVTLGSALALGMLNDIFDDMTRDMHQTNDFLPVSFAITQFDRAKSREEKERVRNQVRKHVIDPLFLRFRDKVFILECPVSLVGTDIDNRDVLMPVNIEAPFLFAIAGTIFRRAVQNWILVREQRKQLAVLQSQIFVYDNLSSWQRFKAWLNSEASIRILKQRYKDLATNAAALEYASADDNAIADSVLRLLHAEQQQGAYKIWLNDKVGVNPIDFMESRRPNV